MAPTYTHSIWHPHVLKGWMQSKPKWLCKFRAYWEGKIYYQCVPQSSKWCNIVHSKIRLVVVATDCCDSVHLCMMAVDIIELKTRELSDNFLISFGNKLLFVGEPGEHCQEFEQVALRWVFSLILTQCTQIKFFPACYCNEETEVFVHFTFP